MNRDLLFGLVISALTFIFIIMDFNINTSDTIKYNTATINIKHPIAYNLEEDPNLISLDLSEKNKILKKEYFLKIMNDGFPLKIMIFDYCEYSPKSFVIDFAKQYFEILSFSSNKSGSDVCAELKSNRYNTLRFIRVIKTKDCTIEIITSKPDIIRFNKMRYKKEVEIIRNIKIIDEKK